MTSSQLYRYIKDGMRLPVSIYKHDKRLLPTKQPITASYITKEEDSFSTIKHYISPTERLQFLYNNFFENFIFIKIDDIFFVLVGPILLEPIRRGAVLSLMEKQHISTRKQKILIDYYSSLTLVTDRQFYISGNLLEMIIASFTPEIISPPNEENFLPTKLQSEETNSFAHSPYFLEQEITQLIANGDTTGARNILSRINSHKKASLATSNLRSLKNSLICDCTFMTRAAIKGGLNPEVSFLRSDSFIREIESAIDSKMLERLELRMIIEFTSLVKNFKMTLYSQTVRSTLDYILKNLKEPINLTNIADALFINASYLSGLFSKEMGITLTSYIRQQRIEQSKWNLIYTDNSVANIALNYQFSSQSYYISCFKKIENQTPLQFRKTNLVV